MTARALAASLLLLLAAAPAGAASSPPPCAEGQSEGCIPACPTGLTGYATEDGGVFLNWRLASHTDVNVYRAQGEGEFVLVERLAFPATRHIDHDVEPGLTYRYQVTAVGSHESPACGTFEVTTVPDLAGAVALALAALLGVLGYVALRRRK